MSSRAVKSCDTGAKSTHLIKSCLKTRKRRDNMEVNDILHKSPSERLKIV